MDSRPLRISTLTLGCVRVSPRPPAQTCELSMLAEMSTGWVIGSEGFAKAAVQAHAAALEAGGEFLLEGGGDRLDDGGDESPPRPFTAPPLHHPAPFVSVFTRTKK